MPKTNCPPVWDKREVKDWWDAYCYLVWDRGGGNEYAALQSYERWKGNLNWETARRQKIAQWKRRGGFSAPEVPRMAKYLGIPVEILMRRPKYKTQDEFPPPRPPDGKGRRR